MAAAASVVSVAASSPVVGSSGPTPRLFGGTFVSSTENAAPDCHAGSHDYFAATAVPMNSQLVCNDDDGDSLTYTLASPPAHGDVSIDPNGQFTYTSDAEFTGDDSFDFKASDGQAFDVATATVSVAATAPGPPSNLAAAAVSTSEIDLSWTAGTDATSYLILRSTSSGGPYTQAGTATNTAFADTGLDPGTQYFYVVRSESPNGESDPSNEAKATTQLAAPTDLAAAGSSTSQIDVTWTATPGATSYQVLRGTTTGGPYTQVGTPTTPAFSDTVGLDPGTTYFYVVTATSDAQQSPQSDEAAGTTLLDAPTSLAAAGVSTTQINLTWTGSAGATSYQVLRGTTTGGPYTQVGTPTTPAFSDTGLDPGTTYYYVVTATTSDAQSPESDEAAGTTLLAAPTSLVATASSPTEIDLTWTGSAGATSYEVRRATATGGPYSPVGTVTTASYSDTGLAHGKYFYVVVAATSDAVSPKSNEASAPADTRPNAVTDSYPVDGNTPLVVAPADGVLANDTDVDNDPLTAIKVGANPAHGTLSFHADGSFTYTPTHDYAGADSFTYNANDGFLKSEFPATVNLDVQPAQKFTLTVARAGTGTGLVTSSPAGINCGGVCSQDYTKNTVVTLQAAPASNSAFAGWSGACTGTATCAVTMATAKNVTATFVKQHWDLKVTKAGGGDGTVTSLPAGINCGASCTANYDDGTSVTLDATPNASSVFDKWTGACSGTSTVCTVTMSGNTNAVANFKAKKTPPPKVGQTVVAGPVSGTVTYKLPGSNTFVPLTGDVQLPNNTIVDTLQGVLSIKSAEGNGKIDTAEIWDGIARINSFVYKPLTLFGVDAKKKLYGTQFTLVEKLDCTTAGLQATKKRKLWGSGKGKFRTKGHYSAATVRGTKWYVEDQCGGTLTKVAKGIVEVQDFVRKKVVLVKAGHSYFASSKASAKPKKTKKG